MDSCKWKISYNNPNQCRMSELARTRTRPPWRPAASSITANMDLDVPPPQYTSRKKATELTIPPQQMNATDLIAAIPKRHRVPKPLPFSTTLDVEEPSRNYLRTPWAPSAYEPPRAELDATEVEKPMRRSPLQQTRPNSEHAKRMEHAGSMAVDGNATLNTGKHESELASPPSGARSLLTSAACSERSFAIASPQRLIKPQHNLAPGLPISMPTSPRRMTAPACDRASPASPASLARSRERSPGLSPPAYAPTPGNVSRHRTSAPNSGLVSPREDPILRDSKPRLDTSHRHRRRRGASSGSRRVSTTDTHNNNLPSRGTTGGGSERSISPCSSALRRSLEGNHPATISGHCSPPTPPSPVSPNYSPYL